MKRTVVLDVASLTRSMIGTGLRTLQSCPRKHGIVPAHGPVFMTSELGLLAEGSPRAFDVRNRIPDRVFHD